MLSEFRFNIVVILFLLFLSGCGGSSSYDKGYDAGYDGAQKSILYSLSESYKQGYEDGASDAYYFDLGCRDKNNEDPPQYPSMAEYMEGYNEC